MPLFGDQSLRRYVAAGIWAVLYGLSIRVGFGIIFLIVSAICFLFINTSDKSSSGNSSGEMSAYSVFNKNQMAIDGQLTSDQFEREMKRDYSARKRTGPSAVLQTKVSESAYNAESGRFRRIRRNDPCICGSKKKYKRCCGQNADKHVDEDSD